MPNTQKKFPTKRKAPLELCRESSAEECFAYYSHRQGMSENKVCDVAGVSQPWFNHIVKLERQTNNIARLVCICVVLGLSPSETTDFLSRLERALSPANPAHQAYLEILTILSENTQYADPSARLAFANAYLRERGYVQLSY